MVQQHTRMKAYLVIILITLVTFQECRATVTISVFLSTYNNPGGKLADGSNCDVPSDCDHKFKVCLDFLGGYSNMGQCRLGNYTIKDYKLLDKNQINFLHVVPIENNPKMFSTTEWPGGMLLKVEVYDDEGILNYDDKVDVLHTEVRMNASRARQAITTRSFKLVNRTELGIVIGVFCDNYWLGPRCDCQHSNDNVTGHYQCFDDGHKECHTNWHGPNCNIYCNMKRGRFHHYNCSPNGSKMCHDNWYGSGCEKYCKPQKDNNAGYSCSSDGEKLCHSGWTGENCTRRCEDELTGVNCKTTTQMTNKGPSTPVIKSDAEDIRGGVRPTRTTTKGPSTPVSASFSEDTRDAIIIGIASTLVAVDFLVTFIVIWKKYAKKQQRTNVPNNNQGLAENIPLPRVTRA